MLFSLIAGTVLSLALLLVFGVFGIGVSGKLRVVLGVVFGIAFVICAKYTEWCVCLSELFLGLRSPHEGKCLPAPSVLDESPAVLKTAGLSKRIRKEVIFGNASLSFPEGKVTAITGQNGAGKTTLAQILCGLARQTRGTYPDRREKGKSGSPAQGDLLLRQ